MNIMKKIAEVFLTWIFKNHICDFGNAILTFQGPSSDFADTNRSGFLSIFDFEH